MQLRTKITKFRQLLPKESRRTVRAAVADENALEIKQLGALAAKALQCGKHLRQITFALEERHGDGEYRLTAAYGP